MPDTSDVLAEIDDTLANWDGSADSSTWTAKPYGAPQLGWWQTDLARHLCAMTGMDGYAAAAAIHDVNEWGDSSPFSDDIIRAAERSELRAQVESATRAWIEGAGGRAVAVFIDEVTEAFRPAWDAAGELVRQAGEAYGQAFAEAGRTVSQSFAVVFDHKSVNSIAHMIDRIDRPRWHKRRCRICNPRCAHTRPWSYGREYHRRLKARARRNRRR